jgi:hypothetical protein
VLVVRLPPRNITDISGQSQPPSQSPTPRTTFPDKLKQYVARTFEDCSPQEKPEVEAELKRIITDAFNEKVVWTIEWEKMPLPQAILAKKKAQEKEERERAQATASQPDSPSKSFSRFSLAEKKRKRLVPNVLLSVILVISSNTQ